MREDPAWDAVLSPLSKEEAIAQSEKEFDDHKDRWFGNGTLKSNVKCYARRLSDNFGWRFLLYLASVYLGVKGLMLLILELVALTLFLFHYAVSVERYQTYIVAIMAPWAMKPLIGVGTPPCCRSAGRTRPPVRRSASTFFNLVAIQRRHPANKELAVA